MSGDFMNSVNIMMAPFIGLVLILFDYRSNRRAVEIHQRILIYAIALTLSAMLCELAYESVKGVDGEFAYVLCWASNTLYFVFQVTAFGCIVLFLDYSVYRDLARLKKVGVLVGVILAVNVIALTANVFTSFMFVVTPDNFYQRGSLYIVRLCISYSLILLVVADLVVSRKQMSRVLFALSFISAFPVTVGSTLDLIVPGARLIWPCFFLSLLFAYLFIVRTNAMIDSLTGVYNRRGCDEFLFELLKTVRRKDYAFIMIDMDHFKDINDNFGHAQGDNALRDMADILTASVRRTDFVARYGGDEFVVIADTREPDKIIEHIIGRIDEINAHGERPYVLAFSYGSGVYRPDDTRIPHEFLDYVDGIMYSKKKERRNNRN